MRAARPVFGEIRAGDILLHDSEIFTQRHLDQCAACREEYETLRDLSRLENEGGPPAPDDLLPPG